MRALVFEKKFLAYYPYPGGKKKRSGITRKAVSSKSRRGSTVTQRGLSRRKGRRRRGSFFFRRRKSPFYCEKERGEEEGSRAHGESSVREKKGKALALPDANLNENEVRSSAKREGGKKGRGEGGAKGRKGDGGGGSLSRGLKSVSVHPPRKIKERKRGG